MFFIIVDYKAMYHRMFNAATETERMLENAASILKEAQFDCEELYLKPADVPIRVSKDIVLACGLMLFVLIFAAIFPVLPKKR